MKNNKSFVVTIQEDPETKDLIMPFPTDLLSQMGWSEGTDLWWEVDENGKVVITQVTRDSTPVDPELISKITKAQ